MWGRKRKELEASVARLQERVRELESRNYTSSLILAEQNDKIILLRKQIESKDGYIKHLEQVIRELK